MRRAPVIELLAEERKTLEAWSRGRSTPMRRVLRARIVLAAAAGNASEGLRLTINGGALGARGTVNFSRGYADQLNTLAADFLTSDGVIAGRTEGLNASIKNIDQRQDNFNQRLVTIEARYRAQFTALDTMLSSLNQSSAFLTQQLASLKTTYS